jgi:hypothetical protein
MAARWVHKSPQVEKSKQAFQESEGPGQPGCLCEVGELPPAQCRHQDRFTVRSNKVAGEAAMQMAAVPDVMQPGWLGLGEEAEMASDSGGRVLRRQ